MMDVVNTTGGHPFFWIAFNDLSDLTNIAYGVVNQGQRVAIGNRTSEIFAADQESDWIVRINQLKGVPNWYEDNELVDPLADL